MRGLHISPAGVDILIAFADPNPELWDAALTAWASLHPRILIDAQSQETTRVVLLDTNNHPDPTSLFPQAQVSQVNTKDPLYAAERLTVEVTLHLLQALVGQAHLLHAAALGDPTTGRAIALVAPSGTGKTTASRSLGQHLVYLTDETAVIQPDGTIRPYPKPLSIIEEGATYKVQYDPATLGMTVADPTDRTYTLSSIVLLNRKPEAAVTPSLSRLPLTDALTQVIGQSSGTQLQERGLPKMADLLNSVGGAHQLTYTDINDALPLLQGLLQGTDPTPQQRENYTYTPAQNSDFTSSNTLHRALNSDGLTIGDRTLIASQGTLTEVSIFAWDCWEQTGPGTTPDTLYQTLQELYGEIPRDQFDTNLEALKAAGILS